MRQFVLDHTEQALLSALKNIKKVFKMNLCSYYARAYICIIVYTYNMRNT